MDAILHKLCEKSQQELWDLLKENNWTKDHAEVAFYMVEILKGVKKIEHLKLVQEAMEVVVVVEQAVDVVLVDVLVECLTIVCLITMKEKEKALGIMVA